VGHRSRSHARRKPATGTCSSNARPRRTSFLSVSQPGMS
jgi:hypothetical protein